MTTSASSGSAILETHSVEYTYGAVPAVRDLTMHVRRGERVALVGANGSGKSTLLRMLDGLLFPQAGRLLFDGRELSEASLHDDSFCFDFRRRVALLFQDSDAQLFNPTVFDEVAFGPVQLGWEKDEIARRVAAKLESMRIAHLRDRPPYQLSGGEKKRVALASVLILEPEVLLLDEPFAAMDPRSQDEFLELLLSLPGDRTVVTATHDLELTREIATRCYVMHQGTAAAEGPVETILTDRALLEETNLVSRFRRELPA